MWDEAKKAWVDTTKEGEEETAPLAPPPVMMAPPGPSVEGNRFGLNKGFFFFFFFLFMPTDVGLCS